MLECAHISANMEGMTLQKLSPCLLPALAALVSVATAAPATQAGRSAQEAARQYGAAVRLCDMAWALDHMYPPIRRTYAEQFSSRSSAASEAENARRIMGLNKNETPAEAEARMRANERKLRDYYVRMGQAMRSKGMKVEHFSVGDPYAEYVLTPSGSMVRALKTGTDKDQLHNVGDRSRLIVLPTALVYSAPDGQGRRMRVKRKGYIFALRDEQLSSKSHDRGTELNKWYFVDGNTDIGLLRAFFPDLPLNIDLPDSGEYPVDR